MEENIEKKPKKLPKDTKFATFESENEDDILMELLIANLIYNGTSFSTLIRPIDQLKTEKDKKEMTDKITNITLDFLKLNPSFLPILKQNDEVTKFLNFFGLDI